MLHLTLTPRRPDGPIIVIIIASARHPPDLVVVTVRGFRWLRFLCITAHVTHIPGCSSLAFIVALWARGQVVIVGLS